MKRIVFIPFVLFLLLILCACSNVPDDFISSSGSAPSQEKADTYSFAPGKRHSRQLREREFKKAHLLLLSRMPQKQAITFPQQIPKTVKKQAAPFRAKRMGSRPPVLLKLPLLLKANPQQVRLLPAKPPVKETQSVKRSPVYGSAGFPARA